MTSKLLLSALAAVAAIVVVAAPQDPSFDYPAAKHVGFDQTNEGAQTPVPAQQERSERVSVTFTDATVREVLDWLKNQGVNFVVTDQQVDKDSHVSINVSDRPISSVMEALGQAWDGHWERKGDIWVFHKGGTAWAPAIAGGITAPAFPKEAPAAPQFQLAPGDSRVFMQPSPMTKEQEQAFERAFQQMNDPKKWEEFNKKMEEWSKGFEGQAPFDKKALEEMEKTGVFRYEMKPGQHGFTWDGKDFKPIDEKHMKDLEKHIVEMSKSGMMNDDQIKELGKQGKVFRYEMKPGEHGFTWNGKDFKPIDEKKLKDILHNAEETARVGVMNADEAKALAKHAQEMAAQSRVMNEEQVKAFAKQAEEMAKQAHDAPFISINGKPLTPEQMKKLEKEGRIKILHSGQGTTVYSSPFTPEQMKEMENAGKIRVLRGGNGSVVYGKALTGKQLQEFERANGIHVLRSGQSWTNVSGHPASSHNLKAIYDLLTPTQIEKLHRLGYINYSDLNSKQRSLLGVITDDNWTISYKTDKANLTIKSDR